MKDVVFVTGNPYKAENIGRLFGVKMDYQAVDLDEIQANNMTNILEHKARGAYEVVKRPVLVDDFSLGIDALDGLPGQFIKFFVQAENGLENICRMADGLASRRATARAYMGYYDGVEFNVFYGQVCGNIADHPRGEQPYAFGADYIFSPDGYNNLTRAELDRDKYDEVNRAIRPIAAVKAFLHEEAHEK